MELKKFFMGLSVVDRRVFAKKCKTSVQHITNIAYGSRRCGEKLAIDIDRESCGAVTCDELRSDVDWDHVRSTQGRLSPKSSGREQATKKE